MNLVERVKAIILSPRTEWPVIEREPGDASYLFTNYVAYLAAIPAVCHLIGTLLLAGMAPFRIGVVAAIVFAVFSYILSFIIVYVVALIADALAPSFNGVKNFPNALKLTVYSYTPAWLVGIFYLIPGLAFLTILGLYAFYLFYLGAPTLMKIPAEKSVTFTLAVVVIGIVISIVLGMIPALLLLR